MCMSVLSAVIVAMNRSAMLMGMRQGRVCARAETVDELHAHCFGERVVRWPRLDIKSSRDFPFRASAICQANKL